MTKFENKSLGFAVALSNVYKEQGEREDFMKLELAEEELTEDFTAMFWGMFTLYCNITKDEVDILGFINIITRLAFQHLTGEEQKGMEDKDYSKAAERVVDALENGKVPITWHEINRSKLEHTIAQELERMDKETER